MEKWKNGKIQNTINKNSWVWFYGSQVSENFNSTVFF